MLEISVTKLRRCDLIRVKGRIDSETTGELKKALEGITDTGRYNIVFNMSDVAFISSAGLNQLIDTMKTCTRLRRGKLVLSDIPENIASTLALAGLNEVFSCYSTEAEAVGNF
jgi:anti-anti-sigma factor